MSTRIMPVSDLRRKTSDVLNTVQETGDPVYITQHGRPVVVLLDYARYEHLLAQLKTLTEQAALAAAPATAEKPPYLYPTMPAPFSVFDGLIGIMPPVDGDALADTEALYDGD